MRKSVLSILFVYLIAGHAFFAYPQDKPDFEPSPILPKIWEPGELTAPKKVWDVDSGEPKRSWESITEKETPPRTWQAYPDVEPKRALHADEEGIATKAWDPWREEDIYTPPIMTGNELKLRRIDPDEVEVPHLYRVSKKTAGEIIKSLDLKVEFKYEKPQEYSGYMPSALAGAVYKISPEAGTILRFGDKVTCYIGPENVVKVPNIKGLEEEVAERIIEGKGLVFEIAKEKTSLKDPRGVYYWEPATEVYQGDTIYVEIEYPQVPDLIGLPPLLAYMACEKAGLFFKETKEILRGAENYETIISQDWEPGTKAYWCDTITGVMLESVTMVPSLISLDKDEAEKKMLKAGIYGEYMYGRIPEDLYAEFSPPDTVGKIWQQTPIGGEIVGVNSKVMSLIGAEGSLRVPTLSGLFEAEAGSALEDIGLVMKIRSTQQSAYRPKGVLGWSPNIFSYAGDTIEVDIEYPEIPDVLGMTKEEADEAILNAQLRTGVAIVDLVDENPGVFHQLPEPGLRARKGDVVVASVALLLMEGFEVEENKMIPDFRRSKENPVIQTKNANMFPSIIDAEYFLKDPIDKYHMYFAEHHGTGIYMATAPRLEGSWVVYDYPVYTMKEAGLKSHISSPEIFFDMKEDLIYLYYHGFADYLGHQVHYTGYATSTSGVVFETPEKNIINLTGNIPKEPVTNPYQEDQSYLRIFASGEHYYGLFRSGDEIYLSRSDDRIYWEPWRRNPLLELKEGIEYFTIRRVGVIEYPGFVDIYYSTFADKKKNREVIKIARLKTEGDWKFWPKAKRLGIALEPMGGWEKGSLRDPYPVRKDGKIYMFYSGGYETGIGLAIAEDIKE